MVAQTTAVVATAAAPIKLRAVVLLQENHELLFAAI